MPCTTIAAITIHTAADSDTPARAKQTNATPARAIADPITVTGVIFSLNRNRATTTATSGAAATMMLDVPAGTYTSPQFNSNW